MNAEHSEYLPRPLVKGHLSLAWVELLYEVTRQFASTLELNEVLGKVLGMTVQAVGANKGSIFVLDGQGQVIRSILARPELPPEVKNPTLSKVMAGGFAGWVYSNKEADVIRDTTEDDRWHVFEGDTLVTRSAIGLPLIRRDRVIGILTLMHEEPNVFTDWHLELVSAIGRQAAAAIENASLYTETSAERSMFSTIISGVRDAILVTDEADRIIISNPAAERDLGFSGNVRDYAFQDVITEPALLDFYGEGWETGTAEREVAFKDGRVFSCFLVVQPELGNILGLHDITTLKELDRLKSEFVSHVSHDLKSPLMMITGYAGLLENDLEGDQKVYLQNILKTVDRMESLIDNILDLGKIEMGVESDFRAVGLGQLAKSAVTSLQSLATAKNIELSTIVQTGMPIVEGSPVRLGQALSNLIQNAIKFTPEGGQVEVSVLLKGAEVLAAVRDTGPGIPAALHARLFQKFSKLGQKSTSTLEGQGLGLAIVKSVVEAHGGRVWVESQPDEGSTFGFAVPAAISDTENGVITSP
jgi:two-component system NtrC family sensor kinase